MAAGDLEARAGVRGHDDLGVLADAIAQMAARLKTLGATYQERQDSSYGNGWRVTMRPAAAAWSAT